MQNDQVLVHHGVKGMKWGVRNGPPYPIEHPVMRKGTKLATVTGGNTQWGTKRKLSKRKKDEWTYAYNPDDKWDSKVYKGPFAAFLRRGHRYVAEHRLEVVRDLKMPNRVQRLQEFKDLYSDDAFNERVLDEMKKMQKVLVKRHAGSEEARTVDLKNLKTDSDWEAAYNVFNHAMEFNYRFDSTREYSKRITSKYDAMVDDNNQGIYNDSHDPVIIFRINDVMYDYGTVPVRIIPDQEIVKNYQEVRDELHKRGKRIAL